MESFRDTKFHVWEDQDSNASCNFRHPNVRYPKSSDLLYAIPVGIVILLIKVLLKRYIFLPLARRYKERYEEHGMNSPNKMSKMHTENGNTVGKNNVPSKKSREVNSKDKKFIDSCWNLTFYSFTVLFIVFTSYDKQWFWNSEYLIRGYPHHDATNAILTLFVVEMGHYWTSYLHRSSEFNRKDKWIMNIHHIISISLAVGTWTWSFFRAGMMIALLHDICDVPLETWLICKYLKKNTLAKMAFSALLLAYLIFRMFMFPYSIMHPILTSGFNKIPFDAYCLISVILFGQQFMNVSWMWMIIKIAYNYKRKDIYEITDS